MPTKTAPKKPAKKTKPADDSPFKELFVGGSIKLSERTTIKVRVVDSGSGPVLDLRQYITSPTFSGYTSKGVSIPPDRLELLQSSLESARNFMRNNVAKKPKGKK